MYEGKKEKFLAFISKLPKDGSDFSINELIELFPERISKPQVSEILSGGGGKAKCMPEKRTGTSLRFKPSDRNCRNCMHGIRRNRFSVLCPNRETVS